MSFLSMDHAFLEVLAFYFCKLYPLQKLIISP